MDIDDWQAASGEVNQWMVGEKIEIGLIAGQVTINPCCRVKLADLKTQKIALLQKYTENYPAVREINQSIAEVEQLMTVEAAQIAAQNSPCSNGVHIGLVQAKLPAEAELSVAEKQKQTLQAISAELQQFKQMPQKEA
ncbi:MAG: hypothetical protein N3A57_05520 [Negativicutes bacterium]|nr:hypothetical protein [Negativicutes bacterium]